MNQYTKGSTMITRNQIFEGTLVAAGWDTFDYITQLSLYTEEDEDILLVNDSAMKKFGPYLNQKVRISGIILSEKKDTRSIVVKDISRLSDGFTEHRLPSFDEFDEFDNLLMAPGKMR